MPDLKYVVDVDLNVDSGSAAKIGRVGDPLGKLQSEAGKVGLALIGGFEGAVEKVGDVVLGMAQIGAAGAAAGVLWGLHLNESLEKTRISIGAILNATGQVGSISEGMGLASDLMAKMRKDAAALPGTFEDLVGIFKQLSVTGAHAGMDPDQIRKLSQVAMATGTVMGMGSEVVGRQMSMLLEGRAGARNVFGAHLGLIGDEAKKFNAEAPDKRVEKIQQLLAKYAPAIQEFSTSMTAVSTTLLTNVRKFATDATGPLYERVKDSIGQINDWFEKNQGTVQKYAAKIGDFLVRGFDLGKAVVMEYGPLLLDFASRAYDELVKVWVDIQPYVKSVGYEIKDFLKSDSSLDKIKTILELYIAAKGVSGAASAVGFLSPLVKAGIAYAGAEGAGAAGAAAAGTEAIGGAGTAAAEGGVTALGISAGMAAAALGLLVGSVAVADHYAAEQQEREVAVGNELVDSYVNGAARLAHGADDASGLIDKSSQNYLDTFEHLRENSQALADAYSAGVDEINTAIMRVAETSGVILNMNTQLAAAIKDTFVDSKTGIKLAATKLIQDPTPFDPASAAKRASERRKEAGKGAGGTVIHKVEISVSTNQNPGQVARAVGAYLAHDSRFRTSSPYTRSFTAPG